MSRLRMEWKLFCLHRQYFDTRRKKKLLECSADILLVFTDNIYKILLYLHGPVFEKHHNVFSPTTGVPSSTVSLAIAVLMFVATRTSI